MQERIQKFLSRNGVDSRRKCEQYILEGKVKVNGNVVRKLGIKVNPDKDCIEFNGKKIKNNKNELIYILLNKPVGYVTTVKEQFGRKKVLDLIDKIDIKLVPVGRLDMYTSGALILTNDGDFVYKVTHPKHEIEKTYKATIKGILSRQEIKQLEQGVKIDDYVTALAKVKVLKEDINKNISIVQIKIHEGKNRQVRKMFEAVNKKVIYLHRTSIGNITIKDMKIGEWRILEEKEVKKLL